MVVDTLMMITGDDHARPGVCLGMIAAGIEAIQDRGHVRLYSVLAGAVTAMADAVEGRILLIRVTLEKMIAGGIGVGVTVDVCDLIHQGVLIIHLRLGPGEPILLHLRAITSHLAILLLMTMMVVSFHPAAHALQLAILLPSPRNTTVASSLPAVHVL